MMMMVEKHDGWWGSLRTEYENRIKKNENTYIPRQKQRGTALALGEISWIEAAMKKNGMKRSVPAAM